MDTTRTIACKLALTPGQRAELDATLVAFADAYNYIADVARQIPSSNKVKVAAPPATASAERPSLTGCVPCHCVGRGRPA